MKNTETQLLLAINQIVEKTKREFTKDINSIFDNQVERFKLILNNEIAKTMTNVHRKSIDTLFESLEIKNKATFSQFISDFFNSK